MCHGGPADHFAVFIPELQKMGAQVHVHATPNVAGRFNDLAVQVDTFNLSEVDIAKKLAEKCSKVSTVLLTDIGNTFSISLQETFKESYPQIKRLVYYDNPESYVPGGYSDIANKTMQLADRVLFSNVNLARSSIYKNKQEESHVPFEKRYGIGYYPMARIQEIQANRLEERKTVSLRSKFFEEYQIQGKDRKIFVYFGGNNDEYYKYAFPAFKEFLVDSIKQTDLSHLVFVIHQHPAAKNGNRDWNLIKDWVEEIKENPKAPTLLLSYWDSNQMQTIADCALYYQTSMAAQFALAGIPTVQIGHDTYDDILIKNGAIPSISSTDAFIENIVKSKYETKQSNPGSLIKYLGVRHDYGIALLEAIK